MEARKKVVGVVECNHFCFVYAFWRFRGKVALFGFWDSCHAYYLISCVVGQFMFMSMLVYDWIVTQVVKHSLLLEILHCHSYVLAIVCMVYLWKSSRFSSLMTL